MYAWVEWKKLYIYIYICGAKGSKDSGPFHIKPKAHAEEEEMPEDEQRESRLLGYTAEEDLVHATSPEAVLSSIPKEVLSLMGQP